MMILSISLVFFFFNLLFRGREKVSLQSGALGVGGGSEIAERCLPVDHHVILSAISLALAIAAFQICRTYRDSLSVVIHEDRRSFAIDRPQIRPQIPIKTCSRLMYLVGASFAIAVVTVVWIRRRRGPLPPGPGGYPVMGYTGLGRIMEHKPWLTFAAWDKTYGSLIHVNKWRSHILVVNSAQLAFELLERKSAIWSNRTASVMVSLVGWDTTMFFLQGLSERHKLQRKMIHSTIGTQSAVSQFASDALRVCNQRLAKRLLETPRDFMRIVRSHAGAFSLRCAYAYDVEGDDDPLMKIIETGEDGFSDITTPGRYIVDSWPFLNYLPDLLGFKAKAKVYGEHVRYLLDYPFQFVKNELAKGFAKPSFTSMQLEESGTPEEEQEIKLVAQAMYGGGTDSTVSVVNSFFLAMTLFPEVQRQAQAEFDSVLGYPADRLATLEDRTHLPFLCAVISEIMRWNPVFPLAAPHCSLRDDVQDGFFLPKGSILIPNVWKFLHDEDTYRDPLKFDPTRFMGGSPERDPRDFCFGFGKRICPGRHLADASVFVTCATILALFNIDKALDASGMEVEPEVDYSTGLASHPKTFRCSISPRSMQTAALVQAFEDYD